MTSPSLPVPKALLLTDVVDSTALAERLGDVASAALWSRHDRIARDLLATHGGREIDKTDGFLLLFDDVSAAVAYAVAYHRATTDLGLHARAGVHFGPVILTHNSPDDVARGAKLVELDGLAKPIAARLMGVASGGQTLLTAEAVAALGPSPWRRTSHGHWRVKGVQEPIEVFEVGDGRAPFAPPPDGAKAYRVVDAGGIWLPVRTVRHRLPAERDPFVGRDDVLRELAQRVADSRLVSLLGFGGAGKTRLATRFAWTWLGDFPGGVFFCDLSEARGAEAITQAVAVALEVPLGRADPVVQLGHVIDALGPCLIVLDNFEQVARDAPSTVGAWLDRAPRARFLVTTREVLGLPGESAFPLTPLSRDEAAGLFVIRARAAGASVDEADPAIGTLVDLLDRLPLALELVASRVRTLTPADVLARMSDRFAMVAGRGGRVSRQLTLRATLDWSWDLLTPAERATLSQLAVFEGGFTVEAAEQVVDLSPVPDAPLVFDAVQALVDKSLVVERAMPGEPVRLDLLVSVQEYAARRRAPDDGAEARHGRWCAALGAEDRLAALFVHGGVERRRALAREVDNLVAACRRAAGRADGAVAARCLHALFAVATRLHVGVALELLDAVQAQDLRPRERCALNRVGFQIAFRAGHLDASRRSAQAALDGAIAIGDRLLEAGARNNLGQLALRQGDFDEAEAQFQAALEISVRLGHAGVARALASLGTLAGRQQRAAEALDFLERARAAFAEQGDRLYEGMTLADLGNVHLMVGDSERARACLEDAFALLSEVDAPLELARVSHALGLLHHAAGRVEDAERCYLRALEVNVAVGARGGEANARQCLGSLVADPERARAYLQSAMALFEELGDRPSAALARETLARREAVAEGG